MGAWAHERGILWALDLTGATLSPLSPRIFAVFDEVRRKDAARLAALMGLSDPDPVLRRFASGRRCFAARVNGEFTAYGWVSRGVECIGEQEREIRLQPDETYVWDCATVPAHRGQRLYSALLSHIVARLRDEGMRRAWIGSSRDNRPSLRGFANAGFRPVITLSYVRLYRMRCWWFVPHPAGSTDLVGAARRALMSDGERAWGPAVVSLSAPAQLAACAQLEG